MPENQEEDTRRRWLLKSALAVVGGGVAVGRVRAADVAPAENRAAQQPPVTRFTPEQVHYQPMPKDWEKCLYCAYFRAPSTCGIVSGEVSKQGWCDHFTLLHE